MMKKIINLIFKVEISFFEATKIVFLLFLLFICINIESDKANVFAKALIIPEIKAEHKI